MGPHNALVQADQVAGNPKSVLEISVGDGTRADCRDEDNSKTGTAKTSLPGRSTSSSWLTVIVTLMEFPSPILRAEGIKPQIFPQPHQSGSAEHQPDDWLWST